MASAIALVGGGEHAAVVLDALRAGAHEVAGVVSPSEADAARLGLPWLGDDAAFLGAPRRDVACVIGVGGPPALRARIADRYEKAGIRFAAVVHPRAIVSAAAVLGEGAVVLAGAVVNPRARLGRHAIVNSGSIIEHDVALGEFTHAAPGTVTGGGVTVGARVHLGLGCRVRDHVRVGDGATVGMGAVVVRDVDAASTVVGVPARPLAKGP
jgi:sugar O-acyltransferase (sialic acid O-acetyltransferase NeuD family)